MMLTIHGLPRSMKYQDIKILLKNECNISDYMLGNLTMDTDGARKVRVGLTNATEGNMLMERLHGFLVSGHVLRVLPNVPKQAMSAPQPNMYNQPRNDYPSQPNYDYGPHGRPMDHGPRPEWGPNNNQWTPNPQIPTQMVPNQMGLNNMGYSQGPMQNNDYMQQQQQYQHHQQPDMNLYGQGPFPNQQPQERILYNQAYHQPPKTSTHNMNPPQILLQPKKSKQSTLRSIEVIDTPLSRPPSNRYTSGQYPSPEKPITIMKDNFQGPSQYNVTRPTYEMQTSYKITRNEQASTWPQPSHHLKKPSSFSKQEPPYDKPYEDRNYPQSEKRSILKSASGIAPYKYSAHERDRSPGHTKRNSQNHRELQQRRSSPPERSISPRRYSPIERRIAHSGRQISPSGRHISPSGRHISSSGRHISPSGRHISPSGRHISSSGRHISPSGRLISSSSRRMSPSGRRSPSERRMAPPADSRAAHERARRSISAEDSASRQHRTRYSPSRRHGVDTITSESRSSKQVRPAYEQTLVPNSYSGGYHPSLHENVQYPILGLRQKRNTWQDNVPFMKHDDERRDTRMFEPRSDHRMMDPTLDTKRSPGRKSRSPVHRNHSPIRFKRHSQSPRSPRRSWALEKRRTPDMGDAPPPPVWPDRDRDEDNQRPTRSVPEKIEMKRAPLWKPFETMEQNRREKSDDRRFERDVEQQSRRETSPHGYKEKQHWQPKQAMEHRSEYHKKVFEHKAYERLECQESRTDQPTKPKYILRSKAPLDKRTQALLKKEEQLWRRKDLLNKRSEARCEVVDKSRKEGVTASRKRYDKPCLDKSTDRFKSRLSVHEQIKKVRHEIKTRVTEYLTRKLIDKNGNKFMLEKLKTRKRIRCDVMISISELIDKIMREPVKLSVGKIISRYQTQFASTESKLFDDVYTKYTKKLKRLAAESDDEAPPKVAKLSNAGDVKEGVNLEEAKKRQQPEQDQNVQQKTVANVTARKDVESGAKIPQVKKPAMKLPDVPSVEPNADGLYEINPRITRVIDFELRHIMIKVWQELPDEPPTDEEQVAVDKFRNQAGDELRNVLGLNVTKRLLNIHNPLHVKLIFSGKTEAAALKGFIERYNITALKRLDKLVNTYVALLHTIADFDNICTTKDVRCGDVKVTVTPCYKFTQCPDKIKTNYIEKEEAANKPSVDNKQEIKTEKKENVEVITSTVTTETDDGKKDSKTGNQVIQQKLVPKQPAVKTACTKENDKSTNIQKKAPVIADVALKVANKQVADAPEVTPNAPNNVPGPKIHDNTEKTTNTSQVISNAIKTSPGATKISNAVKQMSNVSKGISDTADRTPENASRTSTDDSTKIIPGLTKETPNPTKVTSNPTEILQISPKVTPSLTKETPNPTKVTPNPAKVTPNPTKILQISPKVTPSLTKESPNPTKVTPNPTKILQISPKVTPSPNKIIPNPTTVTPIPSTIIQNSTKVTPMKTVPNPTQVTTNAKVTPKATKASDNPTKVTTALNKTYLSKTPTKNKSPKKKSTMSIIQNLIFEEDIGTNKNDLEELNDEDILKLMSTAIVLDECSGSDGE